MASLQVRVETWPIAGAFVISRGARTETRVVVVEICDGAASGRGESTPNARYGETPEGVVGQIEAVRPAIEAGLDRELLQGLMAHGAARNAIDLALWDLEAKRAGQRAWTLAGLARLDPVKTALTISLAEPQVMAGHARANSRRPMLKLKIGGAHDLERVEAVRRAAPRTRLIVDANEALDFDTLRRLAPELAALDVKLLEQPLPAAEDVQLEGWPSPILLCADESLHTRAELAACARRYGCVNIKLDKAGGLTEALALKQQARAMGLEVMVGCMVSTSLGIAPALIPAQGLTFVDLDAPLLLARDREPGVAITGSMLEPPPVELWG